MSAPRNEGEAEGRVTLFPLAAGSNEELCWCEVCSSALRRGEAWAWDHDLMGWLCAGCVEDALWAGREVSRCGEVTGIRPLTNDEAFDLRVAGQ